MTYGNKLVVIEMYGAAEPQQVSDSVRMLRAVAPTPREKRELEDFRARSLAILPKLGASNRSVTVAEKPSPIALLFVQILWSAASSRRSAV